VLITLKSSNTPAGDTLPASPLTLTFMPSNFSTAQTVTVKGANSGAVASIPYSITGTISTTDPGYSNSAFPSVSVTNLGSGIVVTAAPPLITDEIGSLHPIFTVALKTAPTQDVLLPIVSSNANQGQPSPSLLLFNSGNFNVPQTVTLTGVNDNTQSIGDVNYVIHVGPAYSQDNTYNNLTALDIPCTNLDDDATIASIVPVSGPIAGGTAVTITGTNFKAGATVFIGGVQAAVNTLNSTTITATTGAHPAPGLVDVSVTNPQVKAATLVGGFTYFDPSLAPTVTSINPTSGSTNGGTFVTITGTKFVLGATVKIHGASATNITVVNSTSIVAVTGPLNFALAGAGNVVVTNPDTQSGSLTNGFTYVAAPAPTVSSVNPTSGDTNGGYALTITGSNFIAGANTTTVVKLGGSTASPITVTGTTTISTIAGAIASTSAGAVNVVVTNPDGQSGTLTSGFTYNKAATPSINASGGISPTVGSTAGGTVVKINGLNFAAAAPASQTLVSFGGVTAVASSVTATQITVNAPAHAAGTVDVFVINPDQQNSNTIVSGFTYELPLTVSKITPASGFSTGGTSVIIAGSGFVSGATVTLGGTAATNVVFISSTTLTATTPAHTAGAVDVVVTNPSGLPGTLTKGFTYIPVPAPTVTSVSPTSGPNTGGTVLTITGTGFSAGATVTVGGSTTNVTVVSATKITATTTAQPAGKVDVVVQNTDGQSGTLTGGFTFLNPPPTLASIAPTFGPTAGGTAVTITGTGFMSGATVTIGGVAATAITVVSPTSITATTGAHAFGAVDVVVTNSDTQSATLTGAFTYNDPPVINSPLTYTSTGPIATGNTITFSITATDPQGGPITITYDYGDGSPPDTLGQHVYTTGGTYTVTVTISNGISTTTMTTTIVVIQKISFHLTKLQGKENFTTTGKDSCGLQGVLPQLPALLDPTSKQIDVNVGGVPASFVLSSKGASKTPVLGGAVTVGSISLKFKFVTNKTTKVKQFLGGDVKFQMKVAGSFNKQWLPDGVDPKKSVTKTPITMVVDITFNNNVYTATVMPLLTSKAGKSANFTFSQK
jgi:hypothetical protein